LPAVRPVKLVLGFSVWLNSALAKNTLAVGDVLYYDLGSREEKRIPLSPGN
jgi:hypothetical protein